MAGANALEDLRRDLARMAAYDLGLLLANVLTLIAAFYSSSHDSRKGRAWSGTSTG